MIFDKLLYLLKFAFFPLHAESGSFSKPLSAHEEDELLKRMQNGDDEARKTLVEHNLRLVAHIIKKYHFPPNEQDDLISVGTIGLIKGINTFKGDKKIRLATYASKCIENEIFMYFRSLKKRSQDVYISEPIDTDSQGNELTLLDIISVDEDMTDSVDIKIKSQYLLDHINTVLDKRERYIIIKRYGLDGRDEMTQNELSRKLKISRSYVSRIEKRALEKLREAYQK